MLAGVDGCLEHKFGIAVGHRCAETDDAAAGGVRPVAKVGSANERGCERIDQSQLQICQARATCSDLCLRSRSRSRCRRLSRSSLVPLKSGNNHMFQLQALRILASPQRQLIAGLAVRCRQKATGDWWLGTCGGSRRGRQGCWHGLQAGFQRCRLGGQR